MNALVRGFSTLALAMGMAAMAQAAPFESLATLQVKPEQLQPFISALRANAEAARHEPGNLSFSLFQAQSSPTTLYVLEQWGSTQAYQAHLKQPKLLAMHALARSALVGGIEHRSLRGLGPGSDTQPAVVANPAGTSDLLVFLNVKPGALHQFRANVAQVIPTFRAAPGNLAFDIFQDRDHPEQMVQLERWADEQQHQANLQRPVIQTIRSGYAATLATPMLQGRVLLKDITAG
ncbi:antibiotic biosynthesis monooxygenase [Pseudomonas sp. NPDC007930]|uniref:putative quinol monooxygenase n=1 Tax=Pseudomonas sp. NPDC007930 TaxID=3364417 RepID=UPI0036E740DB